VQVERDRQAALGACRSASAALRLPDSKTGAKVVHPGQAAIDVLTGIVRQPLNPDVIVGTLPGKPLSDLQGFLQRVRARAGLQDVDG
jgi:hypothetical protein